MIDSTPHSPPVITDDVPLPDDLPKKRYAHHGKRRRAITEELFRCQVIDWISRSPLVCNHLLWKNRPEELRKHLESHVDLEHNMTLPNNIGLKEIAAMTDEAILAYYKDAARIALEGIPDTDEEEEEDNE